jgi:hypothetical protein
VLRCDYLAKSGVGVQPGLLDQEPAKLEHPAFVVMWSMLRPLMPIPRCRSIVFDNSDKDREGIEVKHTHAHMRREGWCIIGLLLRRRLPDTVARTATSRGLGAMAGGGLRGEKILGGCRWIFFGEEKRGTNSDEIVGRMDSWEGHRAVIHARG